MTAVEVENQQSCQNSWIIIFWTWKQIGGSMYSCYVNPVVFFFQCIILINEYIFIAVSFLLLIWTCRIDLKILRETLLFPLSCIWKLVSYKLMFNQGSKFLSSNPWIWTSFKDQTCPLVLSPNLDGRASSSDCKDSRRKSNLFYEGKKNCSLPQYPSLPEIKNRSYQFRLRVWANLFLHISIRCSHHKRWWELFIV